MGQFRNAFGKSGYCVGLMEKKTSNLMVCIPSIFKFIFVGRYLTET